jgi:hypothetical protein
MFLSHPRLCERSHTPKALLHNTPWEKTNAHQQDYISYTKLTASKHYYKFRAACQTFSSALISMTKKNSNSTTKHSTAHSILYYTKFIRQKGIQFTVLQASILTISKQDRNRKSIENRFSRSTKMKTARITAYRIQMHKSIIFRCPNRRRETSACMYQTRTDKQPIERERPGTSRLPTCMVADCFGPAPHAGAGNS